MESKMDTNTPDWMKPTQYQKGRVVRYFDGGQAHWVTGQKMNPSGSVVVTMPDGRTRTVKNKEVDNGQG
jgi:hypothetical protein